MFNGCSINVDVWPKLFLVESSTFACEHSWDLCAIELGWTTLIVVFYCGVVTHFLLLLF